MGRSAYLIGALPTAPAVHDKSLNTLLLSRGMWRRLLSGVTWSLIGTIIAQVLSLLSSIVSARLLGKVLFGELGIIQNTIGMFAAFAGLGLGMTAAKFVSEMRRVDPKRAERVLNSSLTIAWLSSTLASATLLFAAHWLSMKASGSLVLTGPLRLTAGLLLFTGLSGAQIGGMAGLEAFRYIAGATILRAMIQLPAIFLGAHYGVSGTTAALVFVSLSGCIVNDIFLRKAARGYGITIRYISWELERRIFFGFSLPAFASTLVMGPATWVTSAMLANGPDGLAGMGVFNAANQWRAGLLFLPTIIGQVLLPITSSLQRTAERKDTGRLMAVAILISGICALPCLALIYIFRETIMAWYGPGFVGQGGVLALTACSATLLAIQTPIGNVITATGRMWAGAAMNTGLGISLVAAAHYFLSAGTGASGLAASYLVAYSFHATWTFWFGRRILRETSKANDCSIAWAAEQI